MSDYYRAERRKFDEQVNKRDKSYVGDPLFTQRANEDDMKQGSDTLLRRIYQADRLHGPMPVDALRHHIHRLRMHL